MDWGPGGNPFESVGGVYGPLCLLYRIDQALDSQLGQSTVQFNLDRQQYATYQAQI